MASHEDQQSMNEALANRILTALQEGINSGDFGDAKMIVSMLTIVEALDSEGVSRLSVIISEPRLTTNLGLMAYGQLWIGSNFGTRPE